MRQITHSTPQQIQVSATLDVQSVERELSQLWKANTGATEGEEEGAVMSARVLNLMVYISDESALEEVNELLGRVAFAHPCRVIVMLADTAGPDQDIEMFVSAHCLSSGAAAAGARTLCGEQLTLKARGRFTVELPSAAVPLLVPDLPIFLWWRDAPRLGDETFASLMRAADRVVIDSATFRRPCEDVLELVALLGGRRRTAAAVSDLNWARLTSWRTLLASFYDVAEYREELESINRVLIEYVPQGDETEVVAPKALILAGWLASRLGWRVAAEQGQQFAAAQKDERGATRIALEKDARPIDLEFVPVERRAQMHGWIARIELSADEPAPGRFIVLRSEDGRYLETEVIADGETRLARTLIGNDKSEPELLACELEIIYHDRIYEEALASVAQMLGVSKL